MGDPIQTAGTVKDVAGAKVVTGVGTTNASNAITFAANAMVVADIGRSVSGPGIPAGATLATRPTTTTGTLSAPATATGSVQVTLGVDDTAGFVGWSPEAAAERDVYKVTGTQAAPSRITSPTQRKTQRYK